MTALLLWAIGGGVAAVAGPHAIRTMTHRGADPHLTLATWGAAVIGTLASIVVPVALSLAPSHGGAAAIGEFAHTCWSVLHNDAPAVVEIAVGSLGAATLAVAVLRGAISLRRSARQRRSVHTGHVTLRLILGGGAASGPMVWLPIPTPLAYSVAGRPGFIVASDGLRAQLDTGAVEAVLAHERAHLRGRHHLLVTIAELLAYALPWLPIMRSSPELVRTLVEIAADSHAARRCCPDAVRRALQGLRPHPVPAATLVISRDCTELRLQRLSSTTGPVRPPLLRLTSAVVASTVAVVAPAVPLIALLGAVALAACGV